MLYKIDRHEPLTDTKWSSEAAEEYIEKILTATTTYFENNSKWLCTGTEFFKEPTEQASLFFGSAGVLLALNRIKPESITPQMINYLDKLDSINKENLLGLRELTLCDTNAKGLLLGSSGISWAKYQLRGNANDLDNLLNDIRDNQDDPVLDLMWSAPGTMVLAEKIYRQTSSQLALDLFQEHAASMWEKIIEVEKNQIYLWEQDLYGSKSTLLGMVHGFVGNMIPYLEGFDLLDEEFQKLILHYIECTMTRTAKYHDEKVNWSQSYGKSRPGRNAMLMQICHGAPGVVVSLAKCFGKISEDFDKLLVNAGETIWQADPLTKPSGLCHGTAGNGYAFLELYVYTGDEIWLDRARKFAMHAINQSVHEWGKFGMPYFSLWLGDLGLACFLQDCLRGESCFPIA